MTRDSLAQLQHEIIEHEEGMTRSRLLRWVLPGAWVAWTVASLLPFGSESKSFESSAQVLAFAVFSVATLIAVGGGAWIGWRRFLSLREQRRIALAELAETRHLAQAGDES